MNKILRSRKKSLVEDQSGLASIMVTVVIMIVVTLIVLGFSQVVRRNQRESLDNQLSTQAFYAAETGVNLVQKLMGTENLSTLKKTTCESGGSIYSNQLADSTNGVFNSCLLVDDAPASLVYDDVGVNSIVVPLKPAATNYNEGSLTIKWRPKVEDAANNITSCPTNGASAYDKFTSASEWGSCPVGVLRVDMVDTTAAGPNYTDQSLLNNTVAIFAPPINSSGHAPIVKYNDPNKLSAGVNRLTFDPVKCNTGVDFECSLTIRRVQFNNVHYLRIASFYRNVRVNSISGIAQNGDPVRFIGAQVMVDSTGKAQDVLRRMQVRFNLTNNQAPSFPISSSSGVCKLYSTTGSGSFINGGCPIY